jgi:hypothetical protein
VRLARPAASPGGRSSSARSGTVSSPTGGFQAFFAEARSEIEPMMRELGGTEDPEVMFWRKLETHDEVGWDA